MDSIVGASCVDVGNGIQIYLHDGLRYRLVLRYDIRIYIGFLITY